MLRIDDSNPRYQAFGGTHGRTQTNKVYAYVKVEEMIGAVRAVLRIIVQVVRKVVKSLEKASMSFHSDTGGSFDFSDGDQLAGREGPRCRMVSFACPCALGVYGTLTCRASSACHVRLFPGWAWAY